MSIGYNPLTGNFDLLGDAPVSSVNGETGAVTLDVDDVGAANKFLSNLDIPTAINQDLLPDTNNTRSLGSSISNWSEINVRNIDSDGDLTLASGSSILLSSPEVNFNTDLSYDAEKNFSWWVGNITGLFVGNSILNGVMYIVSNDAIADGETTAGLGMVTGAQQSATGSSNTGYIEVQTGENAGSGSSGPINVGSGNTATGSSGSLTFLSGNSGNSGSSGQVRLITGTTSGQRGNIEFDGFGVRLVTSGTQPAAPDSLRGTFWFTQNGAGVADTLEICIKNNLDAHVWKTVNLV